MKRRIKDENQGSDPGGLQKGRADKVMQNEKNVKRKRQKEAFLESLTRGTSIDKACKAADISVVTIWRWRKENKDFDDEVLAVLDSRTQTVEDALYSNALKGNITAQIFWLKNRAPDRWKDRYEQQLGGEIKLKPLQIVVSKEDHEFAKGKNE